MARVAGRARLKLRAQTVSTLSYGIAVRRRPFEVAAPSVCDSDGGPPEVLAGWGSHCRSHPVRRVLCRVWCIERWATHGFSSLISTRFVVNSFWWELAASG